MSANFSPILTPIDRESQNKVLYTGVDQRRNLFESVVPENIKKTISRGVACLVETSKLLEQSNGYRFQALCLKDRVEGIERESLSDKESFSDELSLGIGTVFLVKHNLAMTAAHCVCEKDSSVLRKDLANIFHLVFGFCMDTSKQLTTDVSKNKVYSIKNVVKHVLDDSGADWAMLELDRSVDEKEISPLNIDFINETVSDQAIYMLGHPWGLPMKYVEGEIKADQQLNSNSTRFQAKIDAFSANSGSPIFNKATNKVIGMLIRGQKDWKNVSGVLVANQPTPEDIKKTGYEKCQKMGSLPKEIIQIIDSKQVGQQSTVDLLWKKVRKLFEEDKVLEAMENFKKATAAGLECKSYEIGCLLAEKYFKQAQKAGFIPTKEIIILNKKIQMKEDTSLTNKIDGEVHAKIENDDITMEGKANINNSISKNEESNKKRKRD